MTRTFQLTDPAHAGNCTGLVVAEISVNCVGEGKGFCRVGNPCVTNEDCESGACSACSGGTCNGVGACQALCGDGFVEAGETCDDGNTTNGDGCSSTCHIESGSVCSGMPSECGTPTPTSAPTSTPTHTPTPTP
jgi:cysteine-rich repeat protein